MKQKIKVGLIGAGNIMRSRHLPALARARNNFTVVGIADPSIERARDVAEHFRIPNYSTCDRDGVISNDWINAVDAVIAAPPPGAHATVIEQCLNADKHLLIEKPFVIDLDKGEYLVSLANKRNLTLAVNHNFQFSGSFTKLARLIDAGHLGTIKSLYCTQFSNDTRRLPTWGDDLPLGLFYDESPHVFYLMRRFSKGNLKVQDVRRWPSRSKVNTPQILEASLTAGELPASIYCNFESPICEWFFMVFGDKRYAMVDLFRDIITVLPNDGRHLMREVFTSSFLATIQHWSGFVSNGIRYVTNRLHYGTDETHRRFHQAILNRDMSVLHNMSGLDGLEVNRIQHDVINKAYIKESLIS